MQMLGSQTGISRASARFSQRAVPVGNVPSTGSALTGNRSPSPASSRPVIRLTKSGAASGIGRRRCEPPSTRSGTGSGASASSARSIAAWLRSTTAGPRLPYASAMASLSATVASSRGNTPDSAKKHGCITVLIRPPSPTSRATRWASMT
jgi:hypothetical protein